MMSGFRGIDKMINKLGSLEAVAQHGMEKAIRTGAEIARAGAVILCPVDTGELRQSIKTDVKTEGDMVVGTVYTNKEYAPYVEFGTGPVGEANHQGISPNVSPVYSQTGWSIPAKADKDGKSRYTEGQPAQPFMYPGLKNTEEIICRAVGITLGKEIVKACK